MKKRILLRRLSSIMLAYGVVLCSFVLNGCGMMPPTINSNFDVTPVKHIFDPSVTESESSFLVIQNGYIQVISFDWDGVDWFSRYAKGTTVVQIPADKHTIELRFHPGEGYRTTSSGNRGFIEFTAQPGKKYLIWLEFMGIEAKVRLDEIGNDGKIIQ